MATYVGAFGVPHTPIFAQAVLAEGAGSETGRLFAAVRGELERVAPDTIVMFNTDHLNTFFLDNLPMLAVGVTDSFWGPNDEPPNLPMQEVPSNPGLAAHIRRRGIADGFDLALAQSFQVDHSFVIPLHFLTPGMKVPVIPVFINGHVSPLPSARRVHALGRSVRAAIEGFPGTERVAIVGSGSFSLEVFGPRIAPGRNFGVPDTAWAEHVHACMRDGDIETLLREATEERMEAAGNVAGELLDWLAMLGAAGDGPASWIEPQTQFGHSYGVWRAGA